MTEIMMSIQPKWVDKILKLEKRYELRKSIPKAAFPFRVFIYQTVNGGVVAEFICDGIDSAAGEWIDKEFLTDTCVSVQDARNYADGNILYKWRIRSLITYSAPKKLSEFGLDKPPQSWCYVKEDK